MYQNPARPNARFTLWLQMHGKLLTANRLAKWGMEVETKCIMCQKSDETREQFVQCEFGAILWEKLSKWMKVH